MKRIGFVLFLVLWLSAGLPAWAANPTSASQVAIGFMDGSSWTSASTGTCIWYFPVVGNRKLQSLFAGPSVDRAHAYLIWVLDFSVEVLVTSDPLFRALAPARKAAIYYSDTPESRDFTDPSDRSTWGSP
jgi:hypothetical protein